MSITWRKTYATQKDVFDAVFNALKAVEAGGLAEMLRPTLPGGTSGITIGTGVDLKAGTDGERNATLAAMGVQVGLRLADAATLSASQKIEQGYVTQLWTAIQGNSIAEVNRIMAARAADAELIRTMAAESRTYELRPSFALKTEAEVHAVFDSAVTEYSAQVNRLVGSATATNADFLLSAERVALLVVDWLRPALVPGTAIKKGNRAQAWFEIRYSWPTGTGGNQQFNNGWAKRHYIEAEMFGLYDDPANVTAGEAQQLYAMLTANRDKILAREASFGVPPDGTASTRNMIAEAQQGAGGALARVQTLLDSLKPAKNAFVAWFNTQLPAGETPLAPDAWNAAAIFYAGAGQALSVLDATSLDGKGGGMDKNLLVGNDGADKLSGGKGNDLLFGGKGTDTLDGGDDNDTLAGGAGNDTLEGGSGSDIYAFAAGDGDDTITDADGNGEVHVAGAKLSGSDASHYKLVDGVASWTDTDGTTYSFHEDGTDKVDLTIGQGSLGAGTITIKDFDLEKAGADGYLGITLKRDKQVAITKGGDDNPFETQGGSPGQVAMNLAEQGAQALTLYLSAAAKAGDTITVSIASGSANLLKLVTGADTLDLSQPVTLTLQEGQTQVVLALISDQPVDSDQTLQLRADWHDGDQVVQSNVADITLKDSGARGQTYLGDQRAQIIGVEIDTNVLPGQPTYGLYKWSAVSWGADGTLNGGVAQADFNDVILAGGGNDKISGLGGNDALDGGAGADEIDGGKGDDLIAGGAGSDVIHGGEGNDQIFGGLSLVVPQRRSPDDTWSPPGGQSVLAHGSNWGVYYTGQAGSYIVDGADDGPPDAAGDYIDAGAGDDGAEGSYGDDQILGGTGNDTLVGLAGDDVLEAGDGNDFLEGDGLSTPGYLESTPASMHGRDFLDGGAGNDELVGGGNDDTLYGGSGNDKLFADGDDDYIPVSAHGDDYLDGEDGDDYLQGSGGDDTLFGGEGTDTLIGDDAGTRLDGAAHGDDYLDGEAGNDTIGGGGGNDTLFGGTGDDFLDGDDVESSLEGRFHGNDYLDGEDGNDLLIGRGGNDTLFGGEGNDELQGDAGTSTIAGSFHGRDYLDGGAGDDHLWGMGSDDTLIGGEGNDVLSGDANADEVEGQFHGNDQLDGGLGDDTLIGGGADDLLSGGDGDDALVGDVSSGLDAGFHGADVLDGGDGNDRLWGDGGNDTLFGGDGNDWLSGEDELGSEDVSTLTGDDLLSGGVGNDSLIGGNGNDWLLGGDGNDALFGGAGDDTLEGGDGNDFLRAGNGSDLLLGGDGNDVYYFGLGSGVKHIEDPSGFDLLVLEGGILLGMLHLGLGSLEIGIGSTGDAIHLDGVDYDDLAGTSPIDAIQFSNGQTMSVADVIAALGIDLPATPDADVITGTSGRDNIDALDGDDHVYAGGGDDRIVLGAGADTADAGEGNDLVTAGDGADLVFGGAGDDTITGDAGDDQLLGDEGSDRLSGGSGNDTLSGGDGADQLSGGLGNDSLDGGSGNDNLDGGTGADMLSGGSGDDTFIVDDANDQVIEVADQGHDAVYSALSLTLSDNVEDLILQAGSAALNGTGNAQDNALTGNDNDNVLNGLAGADTLIGAAGNDTLDGGSDSDAMSGGQGNDLYLVDATTDRVTELNAEGNDAVVASVDFTLSDNVETLMLTGTAIAGTGNALANTITGNAQDNLLDGQGGDDLLQGGAGNDQLVGGSGVDTLVGGTGDDLYDVDRSDDQVVEQAGEGSDTVQSSVSYVLGANLENVVLTGFSSVDATGNELANQLIGNSGSNRLDGGAGNDTMVGGDGDDTYVLDSAADQVIELADEGSDTVVVGFSYATGNNIENVRLTGSANLNATGDAGDNVLEGNAGNNLLAGGGGSDLLIGGDGDDTYIVDSEDDRVVEAAGEGIDTVVRSYDTFFILNDGVENLTLTGTVERGNGNDLDNLIIGNASDNNLLGLDGDDTLIGGAGDDALFGSEGADSLVGGSGDDFYDVDDAGDTLVENADEGDDFIQSSVSWTLGANFERVALTGSDNLNATGNALANGLWGNTGDNTLTGGQGNDFLFGDAGNDVYVYNRGDGQDSVDNTDALGATDTLRFGATITDNDVLAFQSGANLFFKVKGTADQVGFINYYAGNSVVNGVTQDHKIDRIEFSNGVVWDQAMIQTVVDRANNNHSPTVNTFLPTLSAKAGSAFSYTVALNTITDPDVWDSITYRISMQDGSAVPAWLSFDPVTRTMSGTPGTGNVGSLQFVLWGTDNYNFSAGEFVTLNVGPANRAPVVNAALADKTAAQGAPLSFALPASSFTDADADALAYTATLADGSALPGWLSFNASTRTFSGTPPTIGTVSVKVTATDTSNASASDVFDIAVSLQNLVLTGTANADTLVGGTGNDSLNGAGGNDTLIGNAGNDTLNGGTGNDSMTGGAGDDTYVIDSTTDVIVEALNDGIDTVQSTLTTYTLGSNVENLLLGGTTGLSGIGNELANLLTGNSGNNALTGGLGNDTLDGGTGNDTLAGGAGDDVYFVNVATDVVTENANEGIDTINSALTWTVASTANVENITLTGTGAFNATGNGGANVLIGNSGANVLTGAEGNDTYSGGVGNDTLTDTSTTSNDVYRWGTGDGLDTLSDAGGSDRIEIGTGITASQVTLTRSGNNLVIGLTTGTDKLTVSNWYVGTANKIEEIRLANGSVIPASSVPLSFTGTQAGQGISIDQDAAALVSAMAQFSVPGDSDAGQQHLLASSTKPVPVLAMPGSTL